MARASLGHDLRLFSSAVSYVSSVPVFPICRCPITSPLSQSHCPPLAVFQLAHLLSPRGSHYLCCLQDSSIGNALLTNLWVGGVFLCCWNHPHLSPVFDLCVKVFILLSCSEVQTFSIFFLVQFASSTSHVWDTHMGYTLLPLCSIHFPVQHCWTLTVEELRWEQNSKIHKYDVMN